MAALAPTTLPPLSQPLRLSLPRQSEWKLRRMCGLKGNSSHGLVASWVRAIHGLAGLPLKRPRRAQEPSSDLAAAYEGALQRPSPFDGTLDEEAPRRYTLQVDTEALVRFAGAGKRLILSWTTGGPKRYSIARNLALSIRRNCPELERIFAFVALDRDAFERATAEGFQVVLNQGSTDLKDDIWKMRWLIQTTVLSLGLEVLVVDSDFVFLRDPFEHFHFDSDQEAMTDHFFPKEQLWASWLRPAEHINTGFIFARPSPELVAFLVEFLDRNYHEFFDLSLMRDGMDQRVYNRYVMEKMEAGAAFAAYEEKVYESIDWQEERTRRFTKKETWLPAPESWSLKEGKRKVKVRLLDPAEIAHGMNYFWRRAHRLRQPKDRPPAVAHVNGVDPKLYFLRDRNLWYIDDWEERFGDGAFFMSYEHPRGLGLKEDFEHVVAAIEVAAYFRRRVVLPETMNCANSPAYYVWRMNESLEGEGCTYDYFAHANGLYEVYSRHKPYAVEAGLARTARFQGLSVTEMPGLEALKGGALREELLERKGPAFAPAGVLRLPKGMDVRRLRDGLRDGDFGLRMNAQRVFSCAYQQTLASAMACLDETYIEEFGEESLRRCEDVPTGCGPVGICCCWPFWGYGEKLQYFTGKAWDLPCNCGLEVCEGYNRSKGEFCCRHAGDTSLYPKQDEGVFPCKEPGQWQGRTAAEDAHTYSTASLSEFLKGKRTAAQTFKTCRMDRQMRRGDFYRAASLRVCNLQVGAYLLREGALARAKVWWQWLLPQRRGLGNESLLIPALEGNGSEVENAGLTLAKLQEDTEQLQHLVAKASEPAWVAAQPWRQALDLEVLDTEVLPAYEALLRSLKAFPEAQGEVFAVFPTVRPFYNRALYLPDVALPAGEPGLRGTLDFAAAAEALRSKGFAVLDDVLTPQALGLARELLSDSTAWYVSEGLGVRARLADGLHASLGLQLAEELRGGAEVLSAQPLLAHHARKWHNAAGKDATLPRCEDGVIALLFWTSRGEKGGLRLYDESVPADFSRSEAFGGSQAVAELARSSQHRFVAHKENRAVLWRASRIYELLWEGQAWPRGHEEKRVDWIFNFGRSQVRGDKRKRGESFVPTLEGREDGGHYYAQDHDHR